MITGFNTEFRFNNRVFHVQTEDKGLANPKIQTLIYICGEILDSVQGDYSDLLKAPPVLEGDILLRMENQHKRVVQDIKNGKYAFAQDGDLLTEDSIFNERPLEEVFLEFLQNEGTVETMELILREPLTPKFGTSFKFSIVARLCNSKFPIPDAKVSIKLVSSFQSSMELMTGKTDEHGVFCGSVNLPPNQPGHCAVLLSCSSEHGNDEILTFIST